MSLRLNTNLPSMAVQRHLLQQGDRVGDHLRHLGSGLRIQRAADDAAGLGLADALRSRSRSMAVAERNVLDGIGLLETLDGALASLGEILAREHELVLQAHNGTLSSEELEIIEQEHLANAAEITRLVQDTEFNGRKLLNQNGVVEIQVGVDPDQTISIELESYAPLGPGFAVAHMTLAAGRDWIEALTEEYLPRVAELRGTFGAKHERLDSAVRLLRQGRTDLSAAESRIRDADLAVEVAGLARASILQQAGALLLTQANLQPELALRLL